VRDAPPPDPRTSALLVIDVQRYFESMCRPILPAIREAVAGARAREVPVLFTQHGHGADDHGMLHEWWGDVIQEGSDDYALILDPGEDPVLAKNRYCAFEGTDLEERLREKGVKDVAICGVMTNLCVETTARTAFVKDFRVRVLSDATATASFEMQHASLLNLEYGFAHLQTAAEWLASFPYGAGEETHSFAE
jgi:nicotinamidase-related amidase